MISWESIELRELLISVIGGDWGKVPSFENDEYVDVLCIRGTELRNWGTEKGVTAARRKIKHSSLEKRELCEGNLILEISGGGPDQPVGRVELIDKYVLLQNQQIPKICTNFFRRLEIVNNANSAFVTWYLKHFYQTGEIKRYQAGSNNLRNLKYSEYERLSIPLPPLNEQRRIVEKIETLFARLDAGEAALKKVQTLLARYRQSVLKAAVTGELTQDWRAQNAGCVESGHDLLQRILKTRRDNWQGRGKYKEPIAPDTTSLPKLPEGWVWVSLGALCGLGKHALKAGPFGSSLKKSDYAESGYKIYGQEQVIAGDPNIGDYFIGEEKYRELESCKVSAGDVLISLVGTIGKILILPSGFIHGIINPRLAKVTLEQSFYIPEFFQIYFESSFLKSLYKLDAHGATMDILNLGIIKRLPYPLCSISEQQEIVDRVSESFGKINILAKWCQSELTRAKALRQSILKQAFAGRLVPQDPNDEPASELLARIRAECQSISNSKRRRSTMLKKQA